MLWTAFSFWWSVQPVALAIDALVFPIPVLLLTLWICEKPSGDNYHTEVLLKPKIGHLAATFPNLQFYDSNSYYHSTFEVVVIRSCAVSRCTIKHFLRNNCDNLWRVLTFTYLLSLRSKPLLLLPIPLARSRPSTMRFCCWKFALLQNVKERILSGFWLRLLLQAGFPDWDNRNPN
jgi:hypothetical protein